jgi:ketosteroid isomerase-like protein
MNIGYFALALCVAAAAAALLVFRPSYAHAAAPDLQNQARAIVAPLYDALNEPAKKDIAALLAQTTSADFLSFATEDECVGRDAVVARFTNLGKVVSDLRWTIKQIWVSGDEIIVRGEATGTPIQPFLGVQPTGKSFKTMSIDVHTVKGGKIVRTYHLENWTVAIRQLSGN